MLNEHIVLFMEENYFFLDSQYGFRKGRSTGDLLAYLTHRWGETLNRWGTTVAVALDISKAFDRVWHEALIAKLPATDLFKIT
jgi:retron-type reverse transcriptase